jgi:acetylornithine/N-succinyldiaminopimelate aminotransferase
MSHLMNTYARLPVAFTHGHGSRLFDSEGRAYLDALSGIAVNTLGHAHPALVADLREQVGRLIHTSNLYGVSEAEQLSDRLADLSGMQEVFFCNSGCEANEAAIKLARLYGHRKGVENPVVVVMEAAFHGRTLATLSATGNRKVQAGFEPLVTGFVRVPYGDVAALQTVADTTANVVAVLLEPIQGEGGIHVASTAYLQAVRSLCDANEWLMMLDEVQTGIGRTGRWFAHQHADVRPDVMSLAKGLGSGVPIGACLAAGRAAGVFAPGNHGSTFGGNPLACRAALTTLSVIERDELLANAMHIGAHIGAGIAQRCPGVTIRGKGLMIGIELDRPCAQLVQLALAAGLLINVTAERVVRLLPALIFTEADADELIERLSALIVSFMETSQ